MHENVYLKEDLKAMTDIPLQTICIFFPVSHTV